MQIVNVSEHGQESKLHLVVSVWFMRICISQCDPRDLYMSFLLNKRSR